MKNFIQKIVFIPMVCVALFACSQNEQDMPRTIDDIAEDYVKLVLEVGQHNDDFVDAYYGPEELKPAPLKEGSNFPSEIFLERVSLLMAELNTFAAGSLSEDQNERVNMLIKQLTAVGTKIAMIAGKVYSFDKEAMLLYDVQPPNNSIEYFDTILAQLNTKLPGDGTVGERYNKYAKQFVIPKDKIDILFTTAIAEARKRTLANFTLPANENFVLEYVTEKSWSAYNYYKGDGQSLIQINTDFPIFIDRVIDLACHEGYPGHHVFNALLERNLVVDKGWLEFSVYPLFSPQSLIAEGSANYGIEVAFPGATRIQYERDVLFPLAGIDPAKVQAYYEIQALRSNLNYAGNEVARQYLNGNIDRERAASMLEKYLLYSPDRALQRTRFIDQYRSYVINYNLGKDLVADYMEAKGGGTENPAKAWQIFETLLSNPHTASTLTVE